VKQVRDRLTETEHDCPQAPPADADDDADDGDVAFWRFLRAGIPACKSITNMSVTRSVMRPTN